MVGVLSHIALSRKLKLRATDDVAAKRMLLQHILSEVPPTAALTHGRHRLDDLLNGRRDLHLSSHIVGGSRPTALGVQPRDTSLARYWASCPNYARKNDESTKLQICSLAVYGIARGHCLHVCAARTDRCSRNACRHDARHAGYAGYA